MNKDEIKEAIASTIVENGQKGITATALANLLNEIVDAAGSGGTGGGSGAISVKMDVDMGESAGEFLASESRAAAYTSILECLMAGTACNVILCGAGLSATSVLTSADESEDGKPVISMTVITGWIDNAPIALSVSLKSDGLLVMG